MIVREKGRFIPLVKIIFPKGNDRGKYDFSGGGDKSSNLSNVHAIHFKFHY